jgi:carboxynorspermidine decarboxylase
METDSSLSFLDKVPTPAYVIDLGRVRDNLAILDQVQAASGATLLLALKAFAMPALFPVLRKVLKGTCASGPHEARMGRSAFQGLVHTFAPAFKESDMDTVVDCSDHIIFNSFAQWEHFRSRLQTSKPSLKVGLRVNPEVSTGSVPLYDPCAPGCRLGILRSEFEGKSLEGISGLHFHTLCEQNSDALEETLGGFEARFSEFFPALSWVNFGGGHHITRADYDRDRLVALIRDFRRRHGLEVFLEPGEAVVLDAGYLVTEVVDILPRATPVAILDTSATAHMPDVLEMPYRPEIVGADRPGVFPHTYQLGGMTCLAGDVIGDWSFPLPLQVGDRLAFTDMAHYTMVKNTSFNGIQLPHLATWDPLSRRAEVVRTFTYEDYYNRLG